MAQEAKNDRALLTDYLLQRCDEPARLTVAERLDRDRDFRALRDDLANTFSALRLLGEPEVPEDLTARALGRIASQRRSNVVRARRELHAGLRRPMFSLRELGALAAAAVLMACLFIPWARQARRRALAGQCASNVGQIGTAMENYALANNGMLPAVDRPGAAWLPRGKRPAVSNSAGLYRLVRSRYAPAAVFQCAADPGAAGTTVAVSSDANDFSSAKFISYSYHYALDAKPLSRRSAAMVRVAQKMPVLSDSTPLFKDGRFRPERLEQLSSDNHDQTGHNVLFLDWHVEWHDRPTVGVGDDNMYVVQGIRDYNGTEAPANDTDSFLLPAWTDVAETGESSATAW